MQTAEKCRNIGENSEKFVENQNSGRMVKFEGRAFHGCEFCEVLLQKIPLNESYKNFLQGTFYKCFVLLLLHRLECPTEKKFFEEATSYVSKICLLCIETNAYLQFFFQIQLMPSLNPVCISAYCPFLCVQINYSFINRKIQNRANSFQCIFVRRIE